MIVNTVNVAWRRDQLAQEYFEKIINQPDNGTLIYIYCALCIALKILVQFSYLLEIFSQY
jgi:hypothetical protein